MFSGMGLSSSFAGQAILHKTKIFGNGIVDMAKTAGQFEQFKSILEITEGSSEKAEQSLNWVKQFAIDTPSNLDEAMEAFVKLRAYGLDPTNGLLQTLGDTGAAMGKPVMQAVEAIANAVTGENERLKEFGIKGSVIKGKNIIEYQYTDREGIQRVARVNKNDRKQIEKTLSDIFNQKYAGAMEKQAKTLFGTLAKLEDHWINFQVLVMQSGAFDWIKQKLQSFLTLLDKMQQNGELQKWANDVSSVIMEVVQGLWQFGLMIVNSVQKLAKFARENKGVIANFIKWATVLGMVLTALAPVLFSLSLLAPLLQLTMSGFLGFSKMLVSITIPTIKILGKAIFWLGKIFLTNPILLVITGIIAGIILLWKNWDWVCKQVSSVMNWLGSKISACWQWITSVFDNNPILNILFPIVPLIRGIIWVFENWGNITESTKNKIAEIWQNIQDFFNSGIDNIVKTILEFSPLALFVKAFETTLSWFGIELPDSFKQYGTLIIESLSNAITNTFKKVTSFIEDKVNWIKQKLGFSKDAKEEINNIKENADQLKPNNVKTLDQKWSGGYAGNGGKYEPKGIYHGGEYIMTKEATARLGVPLLNALNYSRNSISEIGKTINIPIMQPLENAKWSKWDSIKNWAKEKLKVVKSQNNNYEEKVGTVINIPIIQPTLNSEQNKWDNKKNGIKEKLNEIKPQLSIVSLNDSHKYRHKESNQDLEYIITKKVTEQLGIPLLNALNYGKNAMLATGLGMSVAVAQPMVKVDNRPPLSSQQQPQTASTMQPMQVTININGHSSQSAQDIAREVQKALQQIELQRQAKARGRLIDRD